MIRFACPGCGASYSVDDNKAGKSGKCPKCASQFQIPEAGSSGASPDAFPAPPPPPAASASSGGTVEIDPCPGCQARLSVGASDVGIDVECPYCKTIYRATRSGDRPSSPPPSNPMRFDDDEPAPRSSSRRGRDDDRPRRRDEDDDRPSGRRARSEDDDERPSRRRSRDDDEDDDRPRRRRRSSGGEGGGDGAATAGLILGLIGLVAWLCPLLGFIIGGLAIKYGSQAKTESGGEKGAAGVIMGWICLALSLLNCLAGVAMNAGK